MKTKKYPSLSDYFFWTVIPLLFLAQLTAMVATGCQTQQNTVTIERPPKLVATVDEDGTPRVVDGAVVDAYFSNLIDEEGLDAWPTLNYRDTAFVVVTDESMREYIAWAVRMKRQLGLKYISQGRDCENFADLLAGFAAVTGLEDDTIEAQILIGVMIVGQENDWGGVKAGGAHALCFYYSDKGLNVVESQTGSIASFHEYPNRHYISDGRL